MQLLLVMVTLSSVMLRLFRPTRCNIQHGYAILRSMPLAYLEYNPNAGEDVWESRRAIDYGECIHGRFYPLREEPLYHSCNSIAQGTRVRTHPRVYSAQIFNFFLGINSRRTNIFPSVITSHGKCYRKWDWSKNAIFRVAWLFTFVLLTNTLYATMHLKNIGTTILRFNLIIKWKGDRNSKSSYYLIFLLLFNTAEYNYFVLKQH